MARKEDILRLESELAQDPGNTRIIFSLARLYAEEQRETSQGDERAVFYVLKAIQLDENLLQAVADEHDFDQLRLEIDHAINLLSQELAKTVEKRSRQCSENVKKIKNYKCIKFFLGHTEKDPLDRENDEVEGLYSLGEELFHDLEEVESLIQDAEARRQVGSTYQLIAANRVFVEALRKTFDIQARKKAAEEIADEEQKKKNKEELFHKEWMKLWAKIFFIIALISWPLSLFSVLRVELADWQAWVFGLLYIFITGGISYSLTKRKSEKKEECHE